MFKRFKDDNLRRYMKNFIENNINNWQDIAYSEIR
jgi:hypothetical protein